MIRRIQTASPQSLLLVVLAAAVALASCGGSSERKSVTSAPVVESAPSALDEGIVSESGTDKVPVCHKGENKMVPQGAEGDHLGHGDTPGNCPCPCFTSDVISAAVEGCPDANVRFLCSTDDPASLFLGCAAQVDEPVLVIGIYESRTDTESCKETKADGTEMTQTGLSAANHQACVDAMVSSGDYCS